MNVHQVTEKINKLTENKEYALAFLLVKKYARYHTNTMFNDAHATLLYCSNRLTKAKKLLSYNLTLINKQPNNIAYLISTYFLIALCYLAENNTQKAQAYAKKCLQLTQNNKDLHNALRQVLMNHENI